MPSPKGTWEYRYVDLVAKLDTASGRAGAQGVVEGVEGRVVAVGAVGGVEDVVAEALVLGDVRAASGPRIKGRLQYGDEQADAAFDGGGEGGGGVGGGGAGGGGGGGEIAVLVIVGLINTLVDTPFAARAD